MEPASLEIRLLGELEVVLGGRPLALPASRKTRALLGYLAAHNGTAQLRPRLCELFWEGPADPRAALRWSLSKLRLLLAEAGRPRLSGDRDHVRLVASASEVDLEAVRAAAAGGLGDLPLPDLRAAAARFRGEFLEGLDLPACYRFQAWLEARREEVRGLRQTIFAALVERLGEDPSALEAARIWVGGDPLSDVARAAVVRLLRQKGAVREASAEYDGFRRLLNREFGVGPSAALEEARQARPSPAPSWVAPRAAALPPLPPLVGRARELSQAVARLDAAATICNRSLLLLLGEPGIGKSRLLAELAAAARARGFRVLSTRAFEAETGRPYGLWVDALREVSFAGAPPPPAELALLLSELGPAPAGLADRARLFDAVLEVVGGRSGAGPPTALLLDDLHWIDDASAALLHYVARAPAAARLLLAGAARPGELSDNRAAQRLVRALERERLIDTVELAPLDAGETESLVRGIAPAADAPRVFAESGGNPLFALEVARALAGGEGVLSDSLRGLLRERLARLDNRAAELLPWVAALGREFAPELLGNIAGVDPAPLVAALADLERHAILRATFVGEAVRYDFAHDLIREASYRQTSAPRRRLIHGRIARALAAAPDPDGGIAGEVVHHAALGGEDELAATAAVIAGERCLRLFAHVEAAELAELGLRHALCLPEPARLCTTLDLLKVAVHSHRGQRRAKELAAKLRPLVTQARAATLWPQVQIGYYLLSVLSEEEGNFEGAESYSLQAAELTRNADPLTALRGIANTGRCLAQLEREPRRARSLLREAAKLARREHMEVLDLPWGLGLVHLFAGDVETAQGYLNDALAIARRKQDHWAAFECMARLVMIDLEGFRPAAAAAQLTSLRDVAARLGEGSEIPTAEALAALAALALGEEGAPRALELALASLRAIDTKGLLAYTQNLAAELDLSAGRVGAAMERAREALRAAEGVGRKSQIVLAQTVLARAALLAGDRSLAAAHLEAAADHLTAAAGLSARARRAFTSAAAVVAAPDPRP